MGTDDEATTPLLSVNGPRADIRLNRPKKLNRIEPDDLVALADMLDELNANSELRVVVLTGTGRVFTAGYHLGDLDGRKQGHTEVQPEGYRFEDVADRLENLVVPTICAFNGSVYGGGTDLALACDFRIGVEGMEMLMPAGKLGVHYYQTGMERYVTRLGLNAAKRLFLRARPLSTGELLQIGYIERAVPGDQLAATVDEIADTLASCAPLSLRHMKRALNQIARNALDVEAFEAGYEACMASTDLAEGLAAWKEKRPAQFRGQ